MNDIRFSTLIILCLLASSVLFGQELDLPRKSPAASVSATIGYTNISVNYSAPAAKGRELWGGLVPYGKMWRAGANEATTLCFSTDVRLEDREVTAGCYALFVTPKEEGDWLVVLNKDTSLRGTRDYDEAQEVLRVPVEAKFARTSNQERLSYELITQNIENGYLLLSWGQLRLYLRISVNTMEQAVKAIQEAVAATPDEEDWKVYRDAADFLLWMDMHQPALRYAQLSIEGKPNAEAQWVAAQAYAALGDFAKALEAAKAVRKSEDTFYTENQSSIDRLIREWEKQ
jgi:tetratricopeptide (TPR) repeat protein